MSAQQEVERLLTDLKAVFPPGAKIVQGLEDGFQKLSQQIEVQYADGLPIYRPELDRWADVVPTPLERRILNSLWESRNRGIAKTVLRAAMYFDKPECDWGGFKLLEVKICHLRAKLEDSGLDMWIETMWGSGYRLREGKPPKCRGKYLAGQTRDGPPA